MKSSVNSQQTMSMKFPAGIKSRLQKAVIFIFQENLNVIFCCFLLAVVGAFIYRNAFGAPFIFDDLPQILQNNRIQSLDWPWTFLQNNRRPVLYASLAFNFHQYGFNAFGFHAFNIRVHILAAMFLFLIIRRTCLLPSMRKKVGQDATLLALSASALWLVHPLHTQAVTYIIQRAESLMGLFFLMTLFFSILYFESRKWIWLGAAAVSSLLCGLTKEVALVLPLMVLWYDRTFFSSSFRAALKKNTIFYFGLCLTWACMFYLYFTTRPEEKLTAGFGMKGMTPLLYVINQSYALVQYVKLAFWPNPLVFDYDWPLIYPVELLPFITAIILLLVAFVISFRRYPIFSFLGLSFFLILAPSSSVIPLKDIIFEYRVYLSLSCIIIGTVYCIWHMTQKWIHPRSQRAFFIVVIGILCWIYGGITYQRNKVYQSEEILWKDVIAKRPLNARAYNNLGELYMRQRRIPEAKENLLKSISLDTSYADVFANMVSILGQEGKFEEAVEYAKRAIAVDPDFGLAYNNLGSALTQLGRYEEAAFNFEKALELGFTEEGVIQNLAMSFYKMGNIQKAIDVLLRAQQIHELSPESHKMLDKYIAQKLEKESYLRAR